MIKHGFTIAEIIVVLAVITVLSTLLVSYFNDFKSKMNDLQITEIPTGVEEIIEQLGSETDESE